VIGAPFDAAAGDARRIAVHAAPSEAALRRVALDSKAPLDASASRASLSLVPSKPEASTLPAPESRPASPAADVSWSPQAAAPAPEAAARKATVTRMAPMHATET